MRFTEVMDEAAIIIGESQKVLELFKCGRLGQVSNCSNFLMVHGDALVRDDVSKEGSKRLLEDVLFQLAKQPVLQQPLEYGPGISDVIGF